ARRGASGARGRRSGRGRSRRVLLEQADDRLDRDPHPVGPVVELVAQLIDRLLELEDRQELLRGRLARRQQRAVAGLAVADEERLAGALLPAGRGGDAALALDGGGRVG